jgi:hypothetical protein
MEGNYLFTWEAVAASGLVEGKYEQLIHAKHLEDACDYFTYHHGELSPDENGVCIIITGISWQPL